MYCRPIFLASTFHVWKTNLSKAKHVLESQYGRRFNKQNKVEGTENCERKLRARFFPPFWTTTRREDNLQGKFLAWILRFERKYLHDSSIYTCWSERRSLKLTEKHLGQNRCCKVRWICWRVRYILWQECCSICAIFFVNLLNEIKPIFSHKCSSWYYFQSYVFCS